LGIWQHFLLLGAQAHGAKFKPSWQSLWGRMKSSRVTALL